MRIWIAFLCVAISLSINVAVANDGTKAQCSCDLKAAADDKDGALIRNGARCVLQAYNRPRYWCNFYVKDLKDTRSHHMAVSTLAASVTRLQADSRAVATILSQWFSEWHAALQRMSESDRLPAPSSELLEEILSRLRSDQANDLLNNCANVFVSTNREGRSNNLEGEKFFRCGVHPRGWLTVGLGNFEGWPGEVFYLLAPRTP